MKKTIIISLLIVGIVAANSCKHIPDYDSFIKQATSVSSTCSSDTVYFESDIQPILSSSCGTQGCHDAGTRESGISVANYNDIINSELVVPYRSDKSDIIEVITETNSKKVMPPPPRNKLSADQIAKISKWINQGARNNKCSGACDTAAFKFAANVFPIISNNCGSCHSGTSPSGGIFLNNYTNIQSHAVNGNLLGTIEHQQGYSPMPQGSNKLPDCKITTIRKWIQAGTPNN